MMLGSIQDLDPNDAPCAQCSGDVIMQKPKNGLFELFKGRKWHSSYPTIIQSYSRMFLDNFSSDDVITDDVIIEKNVNFHV